MCLSGCLSNVQSKAAYSSNVLLRDRLNIFSYRKSATIEIDEPIMVSMKKLLTNKNFIFVAHLFALFYAAFGTLDQQMSLIVTPFGLAAVTN